MLEEGVGEQDQGDVVVPTRPRPALEVVEAEFVLQFLVTVFDEVPTLGQFHEPAKGRVGREMGEEELRGSLGPGRPLDQEPEGGERFPTGTELMGRPAAAADVPGRTAPVQNGWAASQSRRSVFTPPHRRQTRRYRGTCNRTGRSPQERSRTGRQRVSYNCFDD